MTLVLCIIGKLGQRYKRLDFISAGRNWRNLFVIDQGRERETSHILKSNWLKLKLGFDFTSPWTWGKPAYGTSNRFSLVQFLDFLLHCFSCVFYLTQLKDLKQTACFKIAVWTLSQDFIPKEAEENPLMLHFIKLLPYCQGKPKKPPERRNFRASTHFHSRCMEIQASRNPDFLVPSVHKHKHIHGNPSQDPPSNGHQWHAGIHQH